jgi:hypothetical protein
VGKLTQLVLSQLYTEHPIVLICHGPDADCPVGFDEWELLASSPMIFFVGDGAWQEVTLVFTPA